MKAHIHNRNKITTTIHHKVVIIPLEAREPTMVEATTSAVVKKDETMAMVHALEEVVHHTHNYSTKPIHLINTHLGPGGPNLLVLI